jgi:RNA polymerase sigma factor (sigma-70 family)
MGEQLARHTDAELVKAICGTPSEREGALQYLFAEPTLRNMVVGYIMKQGGTADDGADVFQEVFILFDRNIRQGKFKGESALRTYFVAIAKWFWVSNKRKQKPTIEWDNQQHDGEVANIDAPLINEGHQIILREAMSHIKDKCNDLLVMASVATYEEIAEEKGYSSVDMVKKAVYRCREEFRAHIKKHPNLESLLKSIIRK